MHAPAPAVRARERRGGSTGARDRAPAVTRGTVSGLSRHARFLTTSLWSFRSCARRHQIAVDEAWVAAMPASSYRRARSQMEGAVIFGMSHTFHGGGTMKRGDVQIGFHDYRLRASGGARTSTWTSPERRSTRASGAGVARWRRRPNAVFALTGRRIASYRCAGFDPLAIGRWMSTQGARHLMNRRDSLQLLGARRCDTESSCNRIIRGGDSIGSDQPHIRFPKRQS